LLEPFEREAKERQGERTDLTDDIRENFPQSQKATDKAGEALGISILGFLTFGKILHYYLGRYGR